MEQESTNTFDRLFRTAMHAKRASLLIKNMIRSQRVVTKAEMSSSYFDKGQFQQLLKNRLFEPIFEHISDTVEITCTEESEIGLKYETMIFVCNPKDLRDTVNYIVCTLSDDQIKQIRLEAGKKL